MQAEISLILDFLPASGRVDLVGLKVTDDDLTSIINLLVRRRYNVRTLNLSHNQITRLPEDLFLLTGLRKLILKDNLIRDLPDQISRLTNLEILSLEDNLLIDLPESIGNLSRLSGLNLQNNRLQRLPTAIGDLRTLVALNLSGNCLLSLPATVVDLDIPTLYLYLSGNPDLLTVPAALEGCESLRWPDRPPPFR